MKFIPFYEYDEASDIVANGGNTFTVTFDESVASVADIKGMVVNIAQVHVAQSDGTSVPSNTSTRPAWSTGIWDGTNQYSVANAYVDGNSGEQNSWTATANDAIGYVLDLTTTNIITITLDSVSTTGATFTATNGTITGYPMRIEGYIITGSDVECEAAQIPITTLTAAATHSHNFTSLASLDLSLGWFTNGANINTNKTKSEYRNNTFRFYTDGTNTRAAGTGASLGSTRTQTAWHWFDDGTIGVTYENGGTNTINKRVAGSVSGTTLTATNTDALGEAAHAMVLGIETSNSIALGTATNLDINDSTSTETISPGFQSPGLVMVDSFGSDAGGHIAINSTTGFQGNTDYMTGSQTFTTITSNAATMSGGFRYARADNASSHNGKITWPAWNETTWATWTANGGNARTYWDSRMTTPSASTTNPDSLYRTFTIDAPTGDLTVSAIAAADSLRGRQSVYLVVQEGGAAAPPQTLTLTAGIASGEATGTPEVVPDPSVIEQAGAIASGETMGGDPVLVQTGGNIFPDGFEDSAFAGVSDMGTPELISFAPALFPFGIESDEAFGSHELATVLPIDLGPPPGGGPSRGIGSDEEFGTANIDLQNKTLEVTGITSKENFGDHEVTATLDVGLGPANPGDEGAAIPSEEAFGDHYVDMARWDLSPTGIASQEAVGEDPVIIPPNPILTVNGIISREGVGEPIVDDHRINLGAEGIDSESAVGEPTLVALTIVPEPANDGETFGNATLDVDQVTAPFSIYSEEAFGQTLIEQSTIGPVGIPSSEAVSYHLALGGDIVPDVTPTQALTASWDETQALTASWDETQALTASREITQNLNASAD